MIFCDHEVDYSITFLELINRMRKEFREEDDAKYSIYEIEKVMQKVYDKYCEEIDEREFGGSK